MNEVIGYKKEAIGNKEKGNSCDGRPRRKKVEFTVERWPILVNNTNGNVNDDDQHNPTKNLYQNRIGKKLEDVLLQEMRLEYQQYY